MLQATKADASGRGTIFTLANTANGQSARAFMPNNLPAGSPLAKAGASLAVALDGFNGNVAVAATTLLPTVIAEHLRTAVRNVLGNPFRTFQKEAIALRVTNAKAMAMALSVVPATVATAPIRARAVKQFDDADMAGKARAIESFSLEQMSGLVEVGALDALPDELATIAKTRFIIMAHVARSGLQAQYVKVPTANDVLGSGADVDAAMRAAKDSLDDLKAQTAIVDSVANVLRDVMTVVALACEINITDAYALLVGNSAN